jgi:hypothetical protein
MELEFYGACRVAHGFAASPRSSPRGRPCRRKPRVAARCDRLETDEVGAFWGGDVRP